MYVITKNIVTMTFCYICVFNFATSICFQAILRDCSDLASQHPSARSGVYNMYLDEQYQAFCDMGTRGGGWTVRNVSFTCILSLI